MSVTAPLENWPTNHVITKKLIELRASYIYFQKFKEQSGAI